MLSYSGRKVGLNEHSRFVQFKNIPKKALLTCVQLPIIGDVVKKHLNTFGYCAAFIAIMLSLMPCCCAMSRITSALCGGKNEIASCCRRAAKSPKDGVTKLGSDHKCCCDQQSKVKEIPNASVVDIPVVDCIEVPINVALATRHYEAVANRIDGHLSAPPPRLVYLSTNLLI